MIRTMYDGINSDAAGIARDFPNASMVAGYLPPSRYAWTGAEWAFFPHAAHVTIQISAGVNAGDVLDVEAGDATPPQTEGWITIRKQAGLYRPTIYCSLNTVAAVRVGTGKWVLGRDWDLWVADWDGTTVPVYPLAAAKQDANTPGYDKSVVFDDSWPHRSAPVAPNQAALVTGVTVTMKDGSTGRLIVG